MLNGGVRCAVVVVVVCWCGGRCGEEGGAGGERVERRRSSRKRKAVALQRWGLTLKGEIAVAGRLFDGEPVIGLALQGWGV